ncbi:dipeptidyl-peptidase 3 family protein [Nibricoccus sp. IMCC34717]|uniref:dipeptidyl-peptidase 3 family protein n=1 Tax=Nibricoccus sp. IMCC34717 TaxID=3034021 RepID=UPI00384F554B
MRIPSLLTALAGATLLVVAGRASDAGTGDDFAFKADRFADIQVLRYRVPGFEQLSLQQKQLAYFLTQAGLSGRDIFWDQKYRHNLAIRKTLEAILETYKGERQGAEWDAFLTYARQVFFSNGVHHHYGSAKMLPKFSPAYLTTLVSASDAKRLPLQGKSIAAFAKALEPLLFDPAVDAKTVNLDAGIDNVVASANNLYRGVTAAEVQEFYAAMAKAVGNPRLSYGLNSQLVKVDGKIVERTWKIGGLYGEALERVVYWLEKALPVAESDLQREAIQHLISFYRTGDINDFDKHCIAWVKDTRSPIDFVNGFIEVYVDAIGKRAGFESVVSMRNEEATKRIAAISAQAQWFEDHSSIADAHKKKEVKGISAKVITVIGEVGDAAPATPVGINLPNAEWIREQHGSKSVSLGNIVEAYNQVQSKSPATAEFAVDEKVAARIQKYGPLASDLHTDMHEVIGHASGQINPGVGTPDQTLKNYASTLEEARADLVALYFAMDPKLVEIGVMPSTEVGMAEYDRYLMSGLITQLYRIEPGHDLQEPHMRNRQLIAAWALEKGSAEKVAEKFVRDGKTFVRVNDYQKLRVLFGQLLREIQRIKSEGDFAAATALVENYGVKVDQTLLAEVHRRYAKLDVAPYMGFIQPKLVPVTKDGAIIDVKVEYPTDFVGQMLEYGREYGFLPVTELL